MAILPIITEPDPFLKRIAEPVTEVNDEIRRLIDDMAQSMYAAPGVGLAAPQVGRSIRLLVADWGTRVDDEGNALPSDLVALINPRLISGQGECSVEEGCLSIPEFTVEIPRMAHIIVEALDRNGEEIRLELDDFPAIVIQHEMDHLDGITLLSRVSPLRRKMYLKKRKKAAIRKAEDADAQL